ncbi:MAG TPA: PaaI family thioesterase [Candidatus Acidoferrales bacterium]|nr:PaaI family thioesterase [Candidatus Acidoferrales bacterium]
MSAKDTANVLTAPQPSLNGDRVLFPARAENPCFGCGGGNPRGMKLEFTGDRKSKRVTGNFRVSADFQGGGGFLHGGIIALILDEAMGKLARLSGERAVTAELSVEYLKPIAVETEIFVEAFEKERNGRQLYHHAEIKNAEGIVLARGRGRFVVPRTAERVAP